MNLALSALLILLFLLPAFSFRIGISLFPKKKSNSAAQDFHDDLISRNVNKALSKLSFTETIFLFSIIPLVLHLVSLFVTGFFFNIDYSLLLNIFSGKGDVLKSSSNGVFHSELLSFLIYSLIEAMLGSGLGLVLSLLLSGKKWVLRILMGNNIWFKIFSGASLTVEQRENLAFVMVEVLAETKESTIIYSGWLKNYEVIPNSDELSYITLTGAKRRDLRSGQITKQQSTTPAETISHYQSDYGTLIEIPGHNFTVPGKEIINVNVTYMKYDMPPGFTYKIPVPII
jgi:hypothetical protein